MLHQVSGWVLLAGLCFSPLTPSISTCFLHTWGRRGRSQLSRGERGGLSGGCADKGSEVIKLEGFIVLVSLDLCVLAEKSKPSGDPMQKLPPTLNFCPNPLGFLKVT